MPDLSAFPITRLWPAEHPDRLQLYSLPTPNGVKVSIMLEEIGLAYEPHLVDIGKNESWKPEYLALNPNGKIPAIIDPNGPDGARRPSSGCSSRWRRWGRCSVRSAISTSSPARRSPTNGRCSAMSMNP